MFEIFKDKAEDFRFRLKAKNGQIVLSGQGYKERGNCIKGIESVKVNSQKEEMFELKKAASGEK